MKSRLLQLIVWFVAGFFLPIIIHAAAESNESLPVDDWGKFFDEKIDKIIGNIDELTLDQAKDKIRKLRNKLRQAYIICMVQQPSKSDPVHDAEVEGYNDMAINLYFDPPPTDDDIRNKDSNYYKQDEDLGDAYKKGVEEVNPNFQWVVNN